MYNAKFLKRLWGIPILCFALAAPAVWADRPEGVGQGKRQHAQEQNQHERSFNEPREVRQGSYFEPRHHQAARDIYGPQIAQGRCPPGLAKKGNGCLPPGQAKQWAIGQPIPANMVLYPVPVELQRRLGPPPAGYKYVRAASDILLIAIGTSMVVDAIEDLGGF
jgi:Ni/Co efflux regulator RcnB